MTEMESTVSLSVDPKELAPKGIDITAEQDGGCLKTIIKEGSGDGGKPCKGDKVNYLIE